MGSENRLSGKRVCQGFEGVNGFRTGKGRAVGCDFRGASLSKAGIENDTVMVRSWGRVPSRMAFARISIAVPASGGK